jgi:ankyrin repeat protein
LSARRQTSISNDNTQQQQEQQSSNMSAEVDLDKFMRLARQGKTFELTQMLAEQTAHVDGRDSFGCTALHTAGDTAVAAVLLEHKAKVDAVANDGQTALLLAAHERHVELCLLLLNAKSNVHHQDKRGRTALHSVMPSFAPCRGGTDTMALLLARNASVHARDAEDYTPLLLCVQSRFCQAAHVRLLLQAQSNANAQDKQYRNTVLRIAVNCSLDVSPISLLLAAGADVNAMSATHQRPIVAVAIAECHEELVELLLRSHADVHAIGASGKTVLQYALEAEVATTYRDPLSPRITALILRAMNSAGQAFAAQARAARQQHIDKHWTDHRLFDINLVEEITQYVAYDRNSVPQQQQQQQQQQHHL